MAEYRMKNKEKRDKYNKEYAISHKEERKEYNAKYYHDNIEYNLNRVKEYYRENKEKRIEYAKKWYLENKDNEEYKKRVNSWKRDYKKTEKYKNYILERKEKDVLFKITCKVRSWLWDSFKRRGYKKNSNTEKIIGCSFEDFTKYLLQTYKDIYGYDWDTKEEVHIDHIIPLSTANSEEEIIKLCHYTNLQLLKAKDNLEKSDKSDYKIKE